MTLADGHVLEGKYVITRRLAEGGMSTVYLGVNQRIGKDVAVKVLHPGVACLPDVVDRFEREARIVSRIRSAHVADVYDFGELPNGDHFMVMEYLEGESLAAILEREHTLSPRTLARIASQILSALCAAHAAGVVHRDLKPENVIVTTRGTETLVKVVDFGISKCVDVSGTQLRKTAADSLMGTPLYMSPEQARGHTADVDQRTDLFALGVILYEATAGEPPFMGENVQDILFKIVLEEPQPLEQRVPSVDAALAAIVRKAMAKLPEQRFACAEDMAKAVEEWRARFSSISLNPMAPESGATPWPVNTTSGSDRPLGTPLSLTTTIQEGGAPTPSPGPPVVAAPAPSFARKNRAVIAAVVVAAVVLGGLGFQRSLAAQAEASANSPSSAAPAPASSDVPAPRHADPLATTLPPTLDEPAPTDAPTQSASALGAARAREPAATRTKQVASVAAPTRPRSPAASTEPPAPVGPVVTAPPAVVAAVPAGVTKATPAPSTAPATTTPTRRAYRGTFE